MNLEKKIQIINILKVISIICYVILVIIYCVFPYDLPIVIIIGPGIILGLLYILSKDLPDLHQRETKKSI